MVTPKLPNTGCRAALENLLLPGKPPGRPWLSLNDPVNLMLLLETFPQEYNSPAKSCNGAAPYPVWAMRSCNPSLHLKPAATGDFPVSDPTDMRIRPLEPLWHLRGLGVVLERRRHHSTVTVPALVRVETTPQTCLWSCHSATAHRLPRARPRDRLPVTTTRLRDAADHVLQTGDAVRLPRRHSRLHSVH